MAEKSRYFAACVLPGEGERVIRMFSWNGEGFSASDGSRFLVEPWDRNTPGQVPVILGEQDYGLLVDEAIASMRTGTLSKVVLSRIIPVPRPIPSPDPLTLFRRLSEAYPRAFCYVMQHPDYGLWTGATPEVLVDLHGGELRTMALAGTRKAGYGNHPWGEKEKEEQEFVVRELVSKLTNFGVPHLSPTRTLQAGPVEHILSEIRLSTSRSLPDLAAALHPTPAVCGWPAKKAHEFIHLHEPHGRELYTGYLGIEEANGDGQLFVNLRCMKMENKRFLLFVGGGITASSKSADEWAETEAKSRTLLDLI